MKIVVHGCPYCGNTTEGFEQKETGTHYLFYDADGNPDGASETNDYCGWKYPRCRACGRKVIIREEL